MLISLLAQCSTAPCRASAQQEKFLSLRKLFLFSSTLLTLIANGTAIPAHAQADQSNPITDQTILLNSNLPKLRWAEGHILVQPRPGLSRHQLDAVLRQHGNNGVVKYLPPIDLYVVQVPPRTEETVVRALSKNPHIKFVERDGLVAIDEVVPTDPYYPSAWHLPAIQAPTAWDITMGSGVTLAVLDTGVDATHPDLAGRFVDGFNAVNCWTYYQSGAACPTNDTTDINGHGTKVAGAAAAAANNGDGVVGVAGEVQIMPIRVTNSTDSYAYWSDIANGLTWAADHGAKIANISYDATNSSSVSSAAQYMQSKGGIVVVAAGNSGTNPGYSDNPYLISVAATTASEARASWSNYGNYIDVAAPGESIWTTIRGGSYGAASGTSFASPVTAGVLALMKAANQTLPPSTLEQILKDTAADLGATDWDAEYGHGRINAVAAVQTALVTQVADTQIPTVAVDAPISGSKVTGITPIDISASDNIGVTRVELYVKGALYASDTTQPFGFSWDTTQQAEGSATLVAYAYDAAGNKGTSQVNTVTVDNVPDPVDTTAPTVQITNPTNGSTVNGNVQITINSTDNVDVTLVNCYVDDKLYATSSSSSMTCSWNAKKASAGAHTIKATAKDAAGNIGNTSIQVNKR